jgi:hypothetical protein
MQDGENRPHTIGRTEVHHFVERALALADSGRKYTFTRRHLRRQLAVEKMIVRSS